MKTRLKTSSWAFVLTIFFSTAFLAASTASQKGAVAAELPPMPEGVTSFAAATLGNLVYVCGGHKGERHDYSAEMVSGSFFRLNLAEGKEWENLPSAYPAMGAPMVAHKSFVYRIGGMAARNAPGHKQDLWSLTNVIRFNTRSEKWENVSPLPEARSSHDAVVIGDRLFVGGGWKMLGPKEKPAWFDHFLVLNLNKPSSGWKSISQPFKRRALALATQGGKVYFIGGMDSDNKTILAVDVYDPRTGQWSKGPSLPDGKSKGFGCSAINQAGRIYASASKGDLLRLSEKGDAWEVVGRLQHPRMSHRLVIAGKGQVIALGGEDGEDKRPDLEVFSPNAALRAEEHASIPQN